MPIHHDRPIASATAFIVDPDTGDAMAIGAVRDIVLTTQVQSKEPAPSPQPCAWGEYIRQDEARVSFVLEASRSPWLLQYVYGYGVTQTLGSPVGYTAELVTIDTDLPAGESYGLLSHADAVGLATGVVVSTASGGVMTQGTDYRLQIVSGYTAVVAIPGGGLTRGDEVLVDYTVTPATSTQIDLGSYHAQRPQHWMISEHGTGRTIQISMPQAHVVSPLQIDLDPKLTRETPIEIHTRRGCQLSFTG